MSYNRHELFLYLQFFMFMYLYWLTGNPAFYSGTLYLLILCPLHFLWSAVWCAIVQSAMCSLMKNLKRLICTDCIHGLYQSSFPGENNWYVSDSWRHISDSWRHFSGNWRHVSGSWWHFSDSWQHVSGSRRHFSDGGDMSVAVGDISVTFGDMSVAVGDMSVLF